jgi:hypothetical protein
LKNNASKNSGMKKRHQARSRSEDSIFSLLQIDLEIKMWTKNAKIMKKRRGWRARINLLRCPPLPKSRAKPLSLENGHF